MALRLRRGTNAERTAITPEAGELVYTTDTKKVYVGDGTTTGGLIVSGQNDIVDDTSPQLGGDLDLNSNNITGTGNINITGTITATGNINLGDGAGSDIIAVGGTIQGALTPDSQLAYNQGSNTARWNTGYYGSLDVLGHVDADSIKADLVSDDSTLAYNQTTKAFTGTTFTGTTFTGGAFSGTTASFSTVTAASFDGDVTGSVFGDDSTVLVDANNNTITATAISTTNITASGGTDLRFNATTTNFNRAQSTSSRVFVHSTTATGFGTGLFNIVNTHANVSTDDIAFSRARGTPDSLTVINANDKLGSLAFNGHDGSGYQFGASIDAYADAISTGNITTNVCIRTRQGSGATLAIGLKVEGDQTVKLNTLDVISGDVLTINKAIQLPISTAEPATPANGQIAIADGTSWNPASNAKQSLVAYLGGAWVLVAAAA
jgi:hypothetical protein